MLVIMRFVLLRIWRDNLSKYGSAITKSLLGTVLTTVLVPMFFLKHLWHICQPSHMRTTFRWKIPSKFFCMIRRRKCCQHVIIFSKLSISLVWSNRFSKLHTKMLAKARDFIATTSNCFKNLLPNVINDSLVGMLSQLQKPYL